MMTEALTRRAALARLGGSAAALAMSACQLPLSIGSQPTPTPAAARSTGPTLVLASSELVVGPNRFAVGLIDETNHPIPDAAMTLSFFQIFGQQATKRAEAQATYRWVDQKTKGIYTAPVTFDTAGRWGVEASYTKDGRPAAVRSSFDVLQQGSAPVIGAPAIRSKTPTVQDVRDPSEICTAAPPCALHAASLDQLLGSGRPTLVLFASPGFCTSATCAPQLDVVLGLKPKYADKVNFSHIEIYKDPRNSVLADTVNEWHLLTEPWTFFVDRSGTIVERFDGIVTVEEIQPVLDKLA
jgi:hypothetical protein